MKQPTRPAPATRRIASFTPGVGAGYTPSMTMATNPPNTQSVPGNCTIIAVCSGVTATSTVNITTLGIGTITQATGPLAASLNLPAYTPQPGYYLAFISSVSFNTAILGNLETGNYARFSIFNSGAFSYCYQKGNQQVSPALPNIEAYDWTFSIQTPFVIQVYQDGSPATGALTISASIEGVLVTYPAAST